MTPYEVLGVDPKSSEAEIRRAYVALARRFHPDANPGGEERMRAVNEAWAILGDRDRRARWDREHRGAPTTDRGFRPHEPADDGFDPRAQPDVPYRPRARREVERRGMLTVAPIVGFIAAVVLVGAGLFFQSSVLVGLGVVLFSGACIAMVVVLLIALVDARHDEG
jgi:hypothetical protein